MYKKFLITVLLAISSVAVLAQNPIRTVGVGATLEDAKYQAFRRAIEFQIGTVLVSNFETENSKVVRNEILAYSSGYVDNYVIVSEEKFGNKVQLVVDVWVSSSKIANRILSTNDGQKPINGFILGGQQQSFADTKSRGDALLDTTLRNYPHNAYEVVLVKSDLMYDTNRNYFLNIQFKLRYNENWTDALKETLSHISDNVERNVRPNAAIMFLDKPNAILESSRWNYYTFNDFVSMNKIRRNFEYKTPMLRVQTLRGATVLQQQCFSLPTYHFFNHEGHHQGVASVKLYNKAKVQNVVQFYFKDQVTLNNTTELKLDIVTKNVC